MAEILRNWIGCWFQFEECIGGHCDDNRHENARRQSDSSHHWNEMLERRKYAFDWWCCCRFACWNYRSPVFAVFLLRAAQIARQRKWVMIPRWWEESAFNDNLLSGTASQSIFEKPSNSNSRYKLKEGIEFHLYISKAPCGDATRPGGKWVSRCYCSWPELIHI